jgi:hypothetical protein
VRFVFGVGWFALLVLRGLLLWALIPFAILAWLLVHRWAQKASFRQSLSWYDRNAVVVLVNGPFRFLAEPDQRPRLLRIVDMRSIEPHAISWLDLD